MKEEQNTQLCETLSAFKTLALQAPIKGDSERTMGSLLLTNGLLLSTHKWDQEEHIHAQTNPHQIIR